MLSLSVQEDSAIGELLSQVGLLTHVHFQAQVVFQA